MKCWDRVYRIIQNGGHVSCAWLNILTYLGGGFKYFLFSSLFGEDSHFWLIFFPDGWFNHQPPGERGRWWWVCFLWWCQLFGWSPNVRGMVLHDRRMSRLSICWAAGYGRKWCITGSRLGTMYPKCCTIVGRRRRIWWFWRFLFRRSRFWNWWFDVGLMVCFFLFANCLDCLDDQQVEKLRVSWAFKTRTRFDDRETKKQAGAWQMALVLLDLFFKFFEHQEDGGYVFQNKEVCEKWRRKDMKIHLDSWLRRRSSTIFFVSMGVHHIPSPRVNDNEAFRKIYMELKNMITLLVFKHVQTIQRWRSLTWTFLLLLDPYNWSWSSCTLIKFTPFNGILCRCGMKALGVEFWIWILTYLSLPWYPKHPLI